MLKRRKRERMNVRPPERVRSPSHLAWVRGHECCAGTGRLSRLLLGEPERLICSDNMEAHHARIEGDGTTGKKPGDDKVVPLCRVHHEEGHRIGWKPFEAKYRVDLTVIAAQLWQWSPHGAKYRAKMKENA